VSRVSRDQPDKLVRRDQLELLAHLARPVPQEQWVRPVRRASRESLPSKSVSSRGV
jgi:hypothetical protein